MPRSILPACCLLFLTLTAARAEDAKPLAVFPMGPDRVPFVTLSFGGKDYECLVLTAVSTTVFHESARAALGNVVGERKGESLYALPAVSLGSVQVPPGEAALCRDLAYVSRAFGRPIDGIVGTELLAKLGLTLDFDQGAVIVHEPTYRPTGPRESVAMVCQPEPYALAQVCGEEVTLAIEIGNGMELTLSPSLVDRYRSMGAAHMAAQIGLISDTHGGRTARYGSLAAGLKGSLHQRVLFYEQRDNSRFGLMGNLFLARYNPTFLFASNEMLLSKSRWHDGNWWPSLRGMLFAELEGKLIVFKVERGSPAAAAGIEPDDEIDLPTDFHRCLELWRTTLPLNLHVRKAGAAHITALRLNTSAAGDAGAQIEPTANTVAAEPFASFPLGPERMAWAIVSFGGKDHRCMLDTGCMTSAWNRSLKPELEVAARAISGTGKYSMPEMAIGSLRVPAGTTGTCVDLDAFSDAIGSQVDGIIGMDVLVNVALSLDFDRGVVTLHPASYRPEGQTQIAKMHCMPRPYTAVGVNGQEVLMMVDSGFDGELSLRADFAGAFCERGEAAILLPVRSATLNGARHSRAGLLAQVSLGDCRPERVRFDELSGDPFDGLIGMGFLGRYNVTFRFAENELVFSKSKWHDAEWWPVLCGMKMADVGGRRVVFSVKPGSSAFRAGVRPDDEVQLPRDFLRRWSFGFSQHHSPFHLTWKKAPLQYEDSVPIEWRKPIWPGRGPVAVRMRRPGAADFVVLQLDDSASLNDVADDGVPQKRDGPPLPAEVDAHIKRWLEEEHVPGASIAVVKDGKVLFSKGYGLANIESLAQATPQTEYEVFSLSQSLTAMAAMLLVRDGKLSLGDKIGDRLPDLPEAWREVTVRHLLNKRSGIPSYAKRRENGEAFSQGGPREAIAFVARDPLTFQPGEQQGYSHTDYLLLALLIEKATGQPFGEFVTQRILDPLGMSQTRLIDLDRDGDLPQVYWWSKKERQTVPYDGHFRVLYTFASNADDLVKLESALSRHTLLDQATIDQMWSSTPPSTTAVGHGFGWQFGTVNGRRWIFAGGSDTGMSRFVDDNLTVIVLTNLRRADVEELSRSIAALFASTLGKQPIDDRDLATTVHLRSVLTDLQRGTSDPADFNANAREQLYLLQAQLASVAALGTLNRFQLLYDVRKDYNTELTYKATFEGGPLMVTFWLDKNAKVDAFSINSVE